MTQPIGHQQAIGRDFDPAAPDSYTFWTEETLRFADLDMVGHVNNNAIGVFLENGRVRLFLDAGEDIDGTAAGTSYTWVLRRIEIDFVREIRFPARVRVGTRLARLGNTSCIVLQGVFVDGTCRATATSVGVCFDPKTRAAIRIPDSVRTRMARHVPGG